VALIIDGQEVRDVPPYSADGRGRFRPELSWTRECLMAFRNNRPYPDLPRSRQEIRPVLSESWPQPPLRPRFWRHRGQHYVYYDVPGGKFIDDTVPLLREVWENNLIVVALPSPLLVSGTVKEDRPEGVIQRVSLHPRFADYVIWRNVDEYVQTFGPNADLGALNLDVHLTYEKDPGRRGRGRFPTEDPTEL